MPDEYLAYLKSVRNLSTHTLESYTKDLLKYEAFLEARGIPALKAGLAEARGFVGSLSRDGLAARSVNRIISGVRGWYRYMERRGEISRQSFCRDPQPSHGKAAAFVPFRG